MLRKAENCNCSCLTRILRKVWTDADSFRCRLQFALGVQSSQFFLGNGFREIGMPNYLIALKSHAQFQRKNEFVSRPCVRHPTRSFRATPSYSEKSVSGRCRSPLQFAVAVRRCRSQCAVRCCSSQLFSAFSVLLSVPAVAVVFFGLWAFSSHPSTPCTATRSVSSENGFCTKLASPLPVKRAIASC